MSSEATTKDIGDVLNVLDVMMTSIDEWFNVLENNDRKTEEQIKHIMDDLDSFVKRQEISDDDRLQRNILQ